LAILDGLSAGMSAWVMVRAPFTTNTYSLGKILVPTSNDYKLFFGVDQVAYSGWLGFDRYFICDTCSFGPSGQIRIEDFIGASSLSPDFPSLTLDTLLLETRYKWLPGNIQLAYPFRCSDNSILIGALPEVGYVQKLSFAEPLYTYNSIYGNNQAIISDTARCDGIRVGRQANMDGAVVAIRTNLGLYRTSHFCFTLLPFDQPSAQVTFNSMMDWLSVQPYITSAGKISSFAPRGDFSRIRQVLDELHDKYNKGLLPASMSSE
jgi:hypothetical protein